MVNARGICKSDQSNAFLCCRFACWPRNKKGTAARSAVRSGRNVPHAPTPKVNSFQISRRSRTGLKLEMASSFSSGSSDSSSADSMLPTDCRGTTCLSR